MIRKFPITPRPTAAPPAEITVHEPALSFDEETGLPWVRWLFQSIRSRCIPLHFRTTAQDRSTAILEWQHFAEKTFLHHLAPYLISAWTAARHGHDAELQDIDRALGSTLDIDTAARSLSAGQHLLDLTTAARHQGILGRYRQRHTQDTTPGHVPVVWSTIATLFQLPPLDLISEYLREEWLAATQHIHHAAEPQGPLGFPALSVKALHAAGIHADFSSASTCPRDSSAVRS